MSPSVLSLMSDENGHVYGVPRDAYALGLMCNVELFEEAGLVDDNGIPKFPQTWDELAKDAKIIKDKTGAAGLCLLAKDIQADGIFLILHGALALHCVQIMATEHTLHT